MRDIKFRLWSMKYKILYYSVLNVGFLYGNDIDNVQVDTENGPRTLDGDEAFVLLQFTGLKDKNGKEIYDRDILDMEDNPILYKQTEFGRVEVLFGSYDDSEIEYGSPAFGWWVKGYHGYNRIDGKKDKYEILENSILTVCDSYEVIGNIYENGDLLK